MSRTVLDFIFMVDFNFDLLTLNGANFFSAHDLFPIVNIPTRVTSHSATLIDNIFVGSNIFCWSSQLSLHSRENHSASSLHLKASMDSAVTVSIR